MSEQQWHIAVDGQQSGPHSLETLKRILQSTNVEASDVKVWSPSMPEWVPPSSVDGLLSSPAQSIAASSAPPIGNEDSGFNPYAPPKTVATIEEPARQLGNHPFDIGKCLSRGWELTKANLGQIVLFGLALVGVSFVVAIPFEIAVYALAGQSSEEAAMRGGAAGLLAILGGLVQQILSIFLGLGATKYCLNLLRGTNPAISDIFSGGPHLLNAILATIIYFAAVMIGLVLLIIPGIYIAIRLGAHQILIVDQKMGPIEALKESWEITRGNVLSMIGLGLVGLLVIIAGMLAVLVGLIWAIPTAYLAWYTAYHTMAYGEESLPQQ